MLQRALIVLFLFIFAVPIDAATKRKPKRRVTPEGERVAWVKTQLMNRGWTLEEIESAFNDERLKPYVPYDILSEESVEAGVKFLEKHRIILDRAKREFEVAPEYLIAVLRKETYFGRNFGSHPTLRLLNTKFRTENEEDWMWEAKNFVALIDLCGKVDDEDWLRYCFKVRGSDAGALGWVQFMPHNLDPKQFGYDGDGDGVIDPFNLDDAVMSAANYLRNYGKRYNEKLARILGWPGPEIKHRDEWMRRMRDALSDYYGGARYHELKSKNRIYPDQALRYAGAVRKAQEKARKETQPTFRFRY